jgi:hypothetical protein
MSKDPTFEFRRSDLRRWIDEIIMAHYHTVKYLYSNQRKDIREKSIVNAMSIFCFKLHMQMADTILNDMGVMSHRAAQKYWWWNDRLKELLGELDD